VQVGLDRPLAQTKYPSDVTDRQVGQIVEQDHLALPPAQLVNRPFQLRILRHRSGIRAVEVSGVAGPAKGSAHGGADIG